MVGVEIHDKDPRGFLSFDLKEILHCLGEDATERVWRCTDLEARGMRRLNSKLPSEPIL